MINSKCKKNKFSVFNMINADKGFCEIRWGCEPVLERILKLNENTGKYEFTGEVVDTEFCTYSSAKFYSKPNIYDIEKSMNKSTRYPSMIELKSIGESLGLDKEMIPLMRDQLKRAIIKHDKSRGANGVENFTINGINLWLDKDTRTCLLLRFQAEKAQGKTNTVLWHEGMQFPLVIEQGIQMLYAIEVYASQTYDLKESLLAEADKLESVDEMITFDKTRTSGYPANLAF